MRDTGLPRVELVERLAELSRAGLTVQALEGDQVQSTVLSRGLLTIVQALESEVKEIARKDYLLAAGSKSKREDEEAGSGREGVLTESSIGPRRAHPGRR